MIQLSDFDFDTVNVPIRVEEQDMIVVVKSGYTQDAIQAGQYFSMACEAAKEQGVELDVEIDNFGVKMKEQTDTYKSLVAQYAEKLVKEWPVDAPLFNCLFENQNLAWTIIRKSDDRMREFFEKKNKQLNT